MFLIRQYVKFNSYDRISTRPFLTLLEKKWIAFQLLKALQFCHSKKVLDKYNKKHVPESVKTSLYSQICHGDIKLENMLVSGWLWLLLTDFASFKPALLPEDNPSDFSYFFDTSRRRTCYLAPERLPHIVLLAISAILLIISVQVPTRLQPAGRS